jgi:predicted heme/steroid binding protein
LRHGAAYGKGWVAHGVWGVLLLACLLGWGSAAWATPDYAVETGRACAACHQDAAGGGGLTRDGLAFQAQKAGTRGSTPLGLGGRVLRLVAGFLHLMTAILWFGTILYVHLMLKPTYAIRGLPKGEVRIGRASMVVMVLTGLILIYYRVPSLDVLMHTRFGILLLVKLGLFLLLVGSGLLAIHVIGPRLQKDARRAAAEAGALVGKRELTREELDTFDGRDGRRAYIAYQGVIYDVTMGASWPSGTHMGRHQAGQDLTRDLALAPHNDGRVREMPVVGTLVASKQPRPLTRPERIFYVMAYLNLGLAVAIVLVVALWRW